MGWLWKMSDIVWGFWGGCLTNQYRPLRREMGRCLSRARETCYQSILTHDDPFADFDPAAPIDIPPQKRPKTPFMINRCAFLPPNFEGKNNVTGNKRLECPIVYK